MAKRNQLVVGQEWAYSRGRNHYIGNYGYEKVIIKDTAPWYQGRWGGNRMKVSSGLGVLVSKAYYWSGEEKWGDDVVQLSQLFIPWSEYQEQRSVWEAEQKIVKEKQEIARIKNEKFKKEIYNPALNEFVQAIKPFADGKYVSGWTRIEELPLEVLQKVTEAIKVGV